MIGAELDTAAKENVLAPLVAADNAAAAWQELDLARKRAVIKTLMTITLRSPGMGTRRAFDPATVQVTWRPTSPSPRFPPSPTGQATASQRNFPSFSPGRHGPTGEAGRLPSLKSSTERLMRSETEPGRDNGATRVQRCQRKMMSRPRPP